MEFCITKTWDGRPLSGDYAPVRMTLSTASNGEDLNIHVDAPYFGDQPVPPNGKPGEPCFELWLYEVVEAFFLNDNDDYLEIELSPYGQHFNLVLHGEMNLVRKELPCTFTASIQGNRWTGDAVFPATHFPKCVTKFNAFAMHGPQPNRVFEALYPVPTGKYKVPYFHNLSVFEPIDMRSILPNNYTDQYRSAMWDEILNEKSLTFCINTTWDGEPLGIKYRPAKLTLTSTDDGNSLKISVDAEFFDDKPVPATEPGTACWELWNHEVVEAFFLNDDGDYLEIELSPHGQHLNLLLSGVRNIVKKELPCEYKVAIQGSGRWIGEAIFPVSYFPRGVTKFNAFAIHGSDPDRIYEALYPVPAGSAQQPDFHNLSVFEPIDLKDLLPSLYTDDYKSDQWDEAKEIHSQSKKMKV